MCGPCFLRENSITVKVAPEVNPTREYDRPFTVLDPWVRGNIRLLSVSMTPTVDHWSGILVIGITPRFFCLT